MVKKKKNVHGGKKLVQKEKRESWANKKAKVLKANFWGGEGGGARFQSFSFESIPMQ